MLLLLSWRRWYTLIIIIIIKYFRTHWLLLYALLLLYKLCIIIRMYKRWLCAVRLTYCTISRHNKNIRCDGQYVCATRTLWNTRIIRMLQKWLHHTHLYTYIYIDVRNNNTSQGPGGIPIKRRRKYITIAIIIFIYYWCCSRVRAPPCHGNIRTAYTSTAIIIILCRFERRISPTAVERNWLLHRRRVIKHVHESVFKS